VKKIFIALVTGRQHNSFKMPTPLVIDAIPFLARSGLYYELSQPDVQLHQDGHGHEPLPVEGLTKARKDGQCLTRIGPDLVPLMELTLTERSL